MSFTPNTKVIENLNHYLADLYVLQLKTQNFHWNVTGPHFSHYHTMFEEQYAAITPAVDEIAERIRALGATTPAAFSTYSKLTCLKDAPESLEAEAMVAALAADHATLASQLHSFAETAAEAGDVATEDMLIAQIQFHQKTLWMLEATLGRKTTQEMQRAS